MVKRFMPQNVSSLLSRPVVTGREVLF